MSAQTITGKEPTLPQKKAPIQWEAWFVITKGKGRGGRLCLGVFDDKREAIFALLRINRFHHGEDNISWNGHYILIEDEMEFNGGHLHRHGTPARHSRRRGTTEMELDDAAEPATK